MNDSFAGQLETVPDVSRFAATTRLVDMADPQMRLRSATAGDSTADSTLVHPMIITMNGTEIDITKLKMYGGIYGLEGFNMPDASPPIDVSGVDVKDVTVAEAGQISNKVDSFIRHAMGLPSHSDADTPDEMSLDSSELGIAISDVNEFKKLNPDAYQAAHAYLLNPEANPKPEELVALEEILFKKFVPYERMRNMRSGS